MLYVLGPPFTTSALKIAKSAAMMNAIIMIILTLAPRLAVTEIQFL